MSYAFAKPVSVNFSFFHYHEVLMRKRIKRSQLRLSWKSWISSRKKKSSSFFKRNHSLRSRKSFKFWFYFPLTINKSWNCLSVLLFFAPIQIVELSSAFMHLKTFFSSKRPADSPVKLHEDESFPSIVVKMAVN